MSVSESESPKSHFWRGFLRAAGADPRTDAGTIRGASGLSHQVAALGFDQDRRRLLVISQEHDARTAALALHDIQYAHPEVQVLLARPVAVNLADVARGLAQFAGKAQLSGQDLKQLNENYGKAVFEPAVQHIQEVFKVVDLNTISQVIQAIQQLTLVRVRNRAEAASDFLLDLTDLIASPPTSADPGLGICSVPLYEFSAAELELVARADPEAAREALRSHDVLQYFFPPADQLALGFIDKGSAKEDEIVQRVALAPTLGHPFGPNELVDRNVHMAEVVDALQQRNMIVEGEMGFELSPEGKTVRGSVRYRPREGLLTKLVERFTFKVDITLSKIFGGK